MEMLHVVVCIHTMESHMTKHCISLIKAPAVCLGFLLHDTVEFSEDCLMKELLHFHYHYRHYNNKLMIRSRECTSDSHTRRHTHTDEDPGAICGNMPPTILISCVNRGLAPLCLGLYHTKSRREMVWTWPHQAEQKTEWGRGESERGWEERSGLQGAGVKASANVLEIRMLGKYIQYL